jgi:hypothetical protein
MEALALFVPAVATIALGGALLVPIRDGRAGRKATLDGRSPLRADFRNLRITNDALMSHEAGAILGDPSPERARPDFDAIDMIRTVAKRVRIRATAAPVEEDIVTERSFAEELSSLLPPPIMKLDSSVEEPEPLIAEPTNLEVREEAVVNITDQRHNLSTAPVSGARVLPLTRLPLRRQSKDVTWPESVSPPRSFESCAERYAFLRLAAVEPEQVGDELLALAFREETTEGRALALAALRSRSFSREAIETFTEALVTGSDDERALAVDALSEAGAREHVARGVTDRIDAIAAKAALAYVGTTARDDYRLALSPLIDESRIEAILALLAGVVE